MAITNSIMLVSFLTLIGVLFPLLRTIIQGKKSTAEDITYYIIHAMLFYPIPELLLTNRQMIPVGNQSIDDMVSQFESGLASEIISINYLILLYLVILNLWLFLKRGKIFSLRLVLENKWIFLIILLNVGLFVNISELIYVFLFVPFLLLGKFERKQIRYLFKIILFLFIYSSFFLIFLKPELTIFHDGSWSGIFTNPNGIVIVANFTLILLLLGPFFRLKRSKWQYFHIGVLFFMVVMSGSRNGLLTFLSILGLYYIYTYRLKLIKSVAIFLSIPGIYLILSNLNNFDLVSLTSNRILIWDYVFEEFSSNIFTGLGADFFNLENREKNFPRHLFFATSSYSSFIDYFVFYGIFGALVITAFMISLFKKTKRINKIFLMFFLLFLLPNLFESYFRPPNLNLNNVIFLIALFIINNSKNYSFYESDPSIEKLPVTTKFYY
ncbi:O-antigen ligase family protein [Salegentibacter sp. JZCK2]|uniref:O-antigen ligase family protein n=1 Tax=Salegentibacter tibetensis TaxID=2873600 RepID=UPI001CCD0E4C|nr:O-antigen ligase family protein [Salegentibacter tibetensis]MBZ9728693.1 O-antigen ligase family protein [Salegentibacter tibetensis]